MPPADLLPISEQIHESQTNKLWKTVHKSLGVVDEPMRIQSIRKES